jgi:hypothetical protein
MSISTTTNPKVAMTDEQPTFPWTWTGWRFNWNELYRDCGVPFTHVLEIRPRSESGDVHPTILVT